MTGNRRLQFVVEAGKENGGPRRANNNRGQERKRPVLFSSTRPAAARIPRTFSGFRKPGEFWLLVRTIEAGDDGRARAVQSRAATKASTSVLSGSAYRGFCSIAISGQELAR
jgi:hypothetical protein